MQGQFLPVSPLISKTEARDKIIRHFLQKPLDNKPCLGYNSKAVCRYAAIAQSVERILGKDEVASSNLASSSKKKPGTPTSSGLSSFLWGVAAITETDTKTDTGSITAGQDRACPAVFMLA